MKAKLARWGNSLAVRIPSEVARDLGFIEGQVVELRQKSEGLEIVTTSEGRAHTPDGIPIYTLKELLADMDRLGPDAVPELVNWGADRGSEIIDDEYSRGEITPETMRANAAHGR